MKAAPSSQLHTYCAIVYLVLGEIQQQLTLVEGSRQRLELQYPTTLELT